MSLLILKAFDMEGNCIGSVSALPDCGVVYIRLIGRVRFGSPSRYDPNEGPAVHTHAVESSVLARHNEGAKFKVSHAVMMMGIGSTPETVRMVRGESYQFVRSLAENFDEIHSDFVMAISR